jgi:WD40 repeat protein
MLAKRLWPLLAVALAMHAPGSLAQPPAKPTPLPAINPTLAKLDQTIQGLDGPGFAIVAGEAAGMIAAACEEGAIQLWPKDVVLSVRHGTGTSQTLRGHQGPVTSLAWNGGPVLASAGVDHTILLWSVADGRVLHTLATGPIIRALALSPDGQTLASAGDDPAVQLWQAGTGKPAARLPGHTDWVMCLAFSPDGRQLASAGYDGVVRLWEIPSGQRINGFRAAPPPPPKTDPEPVIVWSLAFSADGKQLAAGTADGAIHLLNLTDGKILRSLPGHTSAVTGLAFHASGTVLASASKDRTVRLWNPANGQPFKVLEGHEAWVHGVVFVVQGTRLASVGADRTVRLWDLTPTK